jgi:acyl-CoA dehydrogenase
VGAAVLRHPDKVALGAFCVSEPDAGSDVSSLRTRAVYDEANDEWVLNGTKAWITNGGIADIHVVVAAVDPELRRAGARPASSCRPTPRASARARSTRSTASRPATPPRSCSTTCASPAPACSAARSKLDEKLARAREAKTNPQPKSSGKQPAMATFEATRPAVGAQAVGVARAAYEYALQYAQERKAFGKPIIRTSRSPSCSPT